MRTVMVVFNGGYWIGILQQLSFIAALARKLWMSGPFIEFQVRPLKIWGQVNFYA